MSFVVKAVKAVSSLSPIAAAVSVLSSIGKSLFGSSQASTQAPSIPASPAIDNSAIATAVQKPKATMADATQSGTLLTGSQGVQGEASTKKKVLLGQ